MWVHEIIIIIIIIVRPHPHPALEATPRPLHSLHHTLPNMQFLSTLLIAAGLAAAAPAPSSAAAAKPFFLQITSANQAINSKCMGSYHTGAGTADAVAYDCGPAPSKDFVFKGTKLSYTGYGQDGTTPAALFASSGLISYDDWAKLLVNVGDQGTPFTYSARDGFLQKDSKLGFIACQWSHGGNWQVFALSRTDARLPSTCSPIKLLQGCYNTDPGCNA
jgi:hypothetical protein